MRIRTASIMALSSSVMFQLIKVHIDWMLKRKKIKTTNQKTQLRTVANKKNPMFEPTPAAALPKIQLSVSSARLMRIRVPTGDLTKEAVSFIVTVVVSVFFASVSVAGVVSAIF
jgi:hypothetical protein